MERKGRCIEYVDERRMNPGSLGNEDDPRESTMAFYEAHAHDYFNRTVSADLGSIYKRFLRYMKPGGRILDVGSGSGRDLKAFRACGYDLVGIDASPTLAKLASDFSGATCLPMRFEDLRFDDTFDAAWACASLLHIPKEKLPSVLRQIYNILAFDGILFVSVQLGKGEKLLPDGRFFAYYTQKEFARYLDRSGFFIDQSWKSKDSLRSQRPISWLNIIAHRKHLATTTFGL
jgi:SAM-dependent methyltransferase